ncbi:MAG: glycosyltransferase family 4 protein [Chloroflexota bacterium]
MRVGFDISQTGRFKAGCGYFADSLAREMIAAHHENTYILYPTFGYGYWDPDWQTSTLQLPEQPNVVRGPGQTSFGQLEAFWSDPPADFEARLGSPDIVHSNNFFCPPRLRRARLVYTLHDLAFATHPEWTTEANWHTCFSGVFEASLYADHILAVSNYTRRQFLEMFPYFPEARISVVYEASRFAGPTASAAPHGLVHLQPREFWLAVGTTEPRKNHLRLLAAYARLRATHSATYPLVLVGGAGWMMDDLGARIESLGLVGHVQRLGYVDDLALQWLYQNCTAFCYPSLLEGFGLPVVEAMSLGAAVLTSSVTSLPEVVGDAGVLVDPFDVDAICAGMRLLAEDATRLARLRADALRRARQFSWRSAAAQVIDLYRALLEEYPRSIERKPVLGAVPDR